jgi:hypothetical protein
MTRRGSLAYYLAAWICGCFFMSVAICLKDPLALVGANIALAARFIYFYFFCADVGSCPDSAWRTASATRDDYRGPDASCPLDDNGSVDNRGVDRNSGRVGAEFIGGATLACISS